MNEAQDWDSWVDGLSKLDYVSFNFVYSDLKGNIGYYLSGKVPRRADVSQKTNFYAGSDRLFFRKWTVCLRCKVGLDYMIGADIFHSMVRIETKLDPVQK